MEVHAVESEALQTSFESWHQVLAVISKILRLSFFVEPQPQSSPNVIVPRQRSETRSPPLPNNLYRMANFVPHRSAPGLTGEAPLLDNFTVATPAQPRRHSTIPSPRRARAIGQSGASSYGSASWHVCFSKSRSSPRDRRSCKGANEPTSHPFSDIPRSRCYGELHRVSDQGVNKSPARFPSSIPPMAG
jgi:hypothetical protein